jgi:hypothetical protein
MYSPLKWGWDTPAARLQNIKDAGSAMTEKQEDIGAGPSKPGRELTPAAKRARAEAEDRRKARTGEDTAPEKESGGRDGPDPVRYGDWEKDGLTSDF